MRKCIRQKHSRRNKGNQRLKGRGLFKNIQHWFLKTGAAITPIPGLQKALKPKVRSKGEKKFRPLQFVPREFWRAAGASKQNLDKFVYANDLIKKGLIKK